MNSILGSNDNIINKILEFDPNILEQKSRFKALLMDLLPQDKLTKNLILLSYEEQIHVELMGKTRIDAIEFSRICKRLINACGCSRSVAERIVYLWGEALTVEINIVSDKNSEIEKSLKTESDNLDSIEENTNNIVAYQEAVRKKSLN